MEISDEEIRAIETEQYDLFSSAEIAAMQWAKILTEMDYRGSIDRPPASKEAMLEMKKHYNEAQIVEITMVSGFFNFWNRFTDSLQVDIETGSTMQSFTSSTKIDPQDYVSYLRECWWNEDQTK